jgi:hypothetical protein
VQIVPYQRDAVKGFLPFWFLFFCGGGRAPAPFDGHESTRSPFRGKLASKGIIMFMGMGVCAAIGLIVALIRSRRSSFRRSGYEPAARGDAGEA